MGRMFGTDGVRGIAGADLSIELAMQIGRAAGMVVEESAGRRPVFLVGSDTRGSADMLESAMAAGLCQAGADVVMLGVVPTPAVAYLVVKYGADAGVMLSASHNPFEYNGIKIFGAQGFKLTDAQEEEIEQILLDNARPLCAKTPREFGRVTRKPEAVADYTDHICATMGAPAAPLRIAVDCANGSASVTAARIFETIGVHADIFHAQPDGCNINDGCGSTHLGWIAEKVREGGYDLGVAFDGDADRCLAVDENGDLVDGDKLLCMFAYHLKKQGKLKNNTLVATVMSNLGLFKFAKAHDIRTVSTKVGDRYVLETMLAEGDCIGGEQSGHIIFREFMTTGDGQLSAVQLLGLLTECGKPLSEMARLMDTYPQTLLNVHADARRKAALESDPEVKEVIARFAEELGDEGRILVRPSGTEPLIRIMVEGRSEQETEKIARAIAASIEGR